MPEPMRKSINEVIRTFLTLAPKVRANPKSPNFTAKEKTSWGYIQPHVSTIAAYYKAFMDIRKKQEVLSGLEEQKIAALAAVESARQSSACSIGFISGDTLVRSISTTDESRSKMLPMVREKRSVSPLLAFVGREPAIFHDEIGTLEWTLATPDS